MKVNALIILLIITTHPTKGQHNNQAINGKERGEEIAIIKAAWTSLHPGLYRFNTPKEIENYFDDIAQRVSKPMTDQAYFILLSQLATKINCGHTYLNPWNQKEEITNKYFSASYIPFLYRVINQKFIITANLSEHAAIKSGDEILSINGIRVSTIINRLLTVSRSDGNNGIGKKLDNLNIVPVDIDTGNYCLFDIYFPLFFPKNFNTSEFAFVIKAYGGSTKTIIAKSFSKKERQEIYVAKFGDIPVREKNWSFNLLNASTAYLRLGDFETWEWKADYKKYLDSIFINIKQAKLQNLIVDIRGNEGGDDEARDYVLSYLISRPFGCEDPIKPRYRFLNIPDTLLPYLQTWNKEFKKPKIEKEYRKTSDGFYEKIDTSATPCLPTFPKPDLFKGETFLLTNGNNSSTTFRMADIFQSTRSGKVVGEQTGGTKQGINGGQFFFLNLPYSKIEIDLPIIWGASTISRPDEGVKPDYEVKSSRKDIHSGVDTQLNYVLSLIKKTASN